MDVGAALLADRRLVRDGAAAGAVVVADEQARFVRQGEQSPDRTVEHGGVAAGEIAARRTAVGHEDRIADEERIADKIGHAVAGVTGHGDHPHFGLAETEGFVVGEQVIELRAVGGEIRFQVEDRLEGRLHLADAFADADAATALRLQPGRGGEVIGVRMGFQDPAQL